MKSIIFSILVIGILLGSVMIAPLNVLPEAEALKSKGTSTAKYGSGTSGIVCGDRLCSELPKESISMKEKEEKINEDISIYTEPQISQYFESPVSDEILKFTQESPEIDPQKGYFVTEIADGLYWLMDGTYQAMFLTTGEGVIVIDAPQSLGEKYLQAIAEVTNEPVTHLIYSHTHTDHVGAAGMFSDVPVIIAQKQAAEHLAAKNDPNRPVPTVSFDDTFTLEMGNQILELYHIGNYHSKGDIIIYAPQQKVVMIVDYLHPGGAPFKNFGITQDMGAHIATTDILLEMFDDDVLYVSGHENILGTNQHVSEYKQFTNDVLNNTLAAFGTVSFEDIAQQQGPEADAYAIFDGYIDALAASCAQDTIAQWDGKLNGLETFMEDNCTTMAIYAMLD